MIKISINNYVKHPAAWISHIISNNKSSQFLFPFIIALLLLTLFACSQTPDKPSAVEPQSTTVESHSLSTEDREQYKQGLQSLKENDLSNAQRVFEAFVQDKPELAGAYSNLALIHFNKEEYDTSLEFVNKALLRNPEQAQAHQLRAQIMIIEGKIHEAKKDYLKAIELKPNYLNAQYNLALLYDIYFQETELAIQHYEIYLSLLTKPDEATQEWVNHLKGTLKNG